MREKSFFGRKEIFSTRGKDVFPTWKIFFPGRENLCVKLKNHKPLHCSRLCGNPEESFFLL
ncbi:hypothetical protein NY148_06935 [Porphyromonas gingivalis]|uniref:hypothetical protein n=1 Tax=Porphyromonas gingivalis TaxID=837 RepID=UPI0011873026|nr:hypothetical protein [Porphyromonas gingivalis]USI93237.1 hypothetical protein MCS24_05705 [Porphyromonas gingivalis]USI96361.1 hypothetical protein MCS27_02295 [Porphyromonas gingivalis]USI98272.1 hypothetical protein MCS25_02295 [Porphyromonas gingivalis]WCG00506.1 hypothetical protein NY148_06935 [Porphyromonas gingivalis]